MNNFRIIIAVLSIIVLQSCNKYDANGRLIKEYEELDKAKFLLGDWEKTDSIGTLIENWKTENDSTFLGKSFFVINKDTIRRESIEMMQDKEHLLYTSTIIGENNDEPIPYQMTQSTDSLLVFENPKYDYPKKITYKLTGEKRITATISGILKGKNSSESYQLAKIK
ncbi:DUF6265 family protein [Flavobacterium sp.]|uniref:DUF6265 family protein n=1 Tax=Flavobacterium sp. TaxID=239 RepID=UPI003750D1DD